MAGRPPCETVRRLLRAVARSVARVVPCTRRKSGLLGVTPDEDIVNPNQLMNGYFCLRKELSLTADQTVQQIFP